MSRAGRWLRVVVGLALVMLGTLPLYRLTEGEEAGLAGRATAEIVAVQAGALWSGFLVLLLVALLGGVLLPQGSATSLLSRIRSWVLAPGPRVFAALAAAVGFATTTWFAVVVLEGKPNLIDAMAQLLQARYLAAGRLAAPVPDDPAFWFIQNTVLTPEGWVSQYPPGHAMLLAAGLALRAVEVVPGLLMAVTAGFTVLTVRRLLPDDELVARMAGIGTALSPFLVAQTGSFMSHGSAAALSVLAVYAAARARSGGAGWGLAIGAALGLLVTSRPLFAITIGLGVVVPMGIATARAGDRTTAAVAARAALAVVAALPFLLALAAYNARFFGGPLELGYVQAWGEAHGLGFHRDPWGNLYTPLAALAYTSADLTALSLSLFETPIPLVPIIGVWLALSRRLRPGEGILVAWALLPVVANFFYWHHSYFMGPRMLAEAAPPWTALAALAVVALVRRVPDDLPGDRSLRFRPRAAATTLLVAGAAAAAWLGPVRLVNRGGDFLRSLRLEPPSTSEPALVFVHGGWGGRVFGRLAAAGLPLHALEAALGRNDLCRLHQAVEAGGDPEAEGIQLRPLPRRPDLVDVEVYPNHEVLLDRDRWAAGALALPAGCREELASDRIGTAPLAPLLWRSGLPGMEQDRTLYVRDLGPARNARLLARHSDREAYFLVRDRTRPELRLLPYGEGERLLWPRPAPEPFGGEAAR